jgi:hypothetical protein
MKINEPCAAGVSHRKTLSPYGAFHQLEARRNQAMGLAYIR